MPHAVFLLPGVGAQGGRVEDLAAAFAPGPAGGLIAASRGIVRAYEKAGGRSRDGGQARGGEAARAGLEACELTSALRPVEGRLREARLV